MVVRAGAAVVAVREATAVAVSATGSGSQMSSATASHCVHSVQDVPRLDDAVHRWINGGMGGIDGSPYFTPERLRQIARQTWQELKEAGGQAIKTVSIHDAIEALGEEVEHALDLEMEYKR